MDDSPGGLSIDHVRFYVADANSTAAELVQRYGFEVVARDLEGHSVAVGLGDIVLVMTEGTTDEHPASTFVQAHGDGVVDIALRTTDIRRTFDEATTAGARVLAEPARVDGCVTATIAAFGDVVHTLVQRPPENGDDRCPPTLRPAQPESTAASGSPGLGRLDHLAVCLPAGELEPTVDFYRSALGFRKIYEERIVVGSQAMDSQVVQSDSGAVTLTLIEPDTSRDPGQIDEYVKENGGPGVQHIAMTSQDIVDSVTDLRERGVTFLDTPDSYYDLLPGRLTLASHTVDELRGLDILADSDHHGQLFQIFTRSVHPRRTFFFEVIERLGARTFGSGNIKALYEAVEMERRS